MDEREEYLDKHGVSTLVEKIKKDFLNKDLSISMTSDEIDNLIETAINEACVENYGG